MLSKRIALQSRDLYKKGRNRKLRNPGICITKGVKKTLQTRNLYKKRGNKKLCNQGTFRKRRNTKKLCNQGSREGSDPMRKDGRSADGGNVTAARRQGSQVLAF